MLEFMPTVVLDLLNPRNYLVNHTWDRVGADRECPTCGAQPGQQCSDAHGTEWATKIHPARAEEKR